MSFLWLLVHVRRQNWASYCSRFVRLSIDLQWLGPSLTFLSQHMAYPRFELLGRAGASLSESLPNIQVRPIENIRFNEYSTSIPSRLPFFLPLSTLKPQNCYVNWIWRSTSVLQSSVAPHHFECGRLGISLQAERVKKLTVTMLNVSAIENSRAWREFIGDPFRRLPDRLL